MKKTVSNKNILNNQNVDIVTDQISFAGFQIKVDFSFCLIMDKG